VKCRVVDLITLLSRPEGKTLEFKRVISSPDGVLKAIVAFANTSGGVLVLGVEDGTKRVKGIPTYWRRKSVLPI
jgi:predicted HTH transcriptional regulator